MNSRDLLDRLRRRYAAPAHALFAEVGDETAGRSRSADAIVMGLWPSRGVDLHGFEIKVDRRDWIRELKRPEKAEPIARFCDFWWLVVSDQAIVKDGELPGNWGMLVPKGNDLVAAVEAKRLEAVPITRKFLAAILRAAHKVSPLEQAVLDAREAGIKIGEERAKRDYTVERANREMETLQISVDAFEKASGLKIKQYNGANLGRAVALLHKLDTDGGRQQFEHMRWQAERIVKQVDDVLAALPKDKT